MPVKGHQDVGFLETIGESSIGPLVDFIDLWWDFNYFYSKLGLYRPFIGFLGSFLKGTCRDLLVRFLQAFS